MVSFALIFTGSLMYSLACYIEQRYSLSALWFAVTTYQTLSMYIQYKGM